MKPFSRPARTSAKLSDSVHHQLNMYALAASAAGVSLLALASPAEGRIIYTHIHKVIKVHEHYGLDLNHDGITDFTIQLTSKFMTGWYHFFTLQALSPRNNAVAGVKNTKTFGWSSAFAFYRGDLVGRPKQPFYGTLMAVLGTDGLRTASGGTGRWRNAKNRYLGLKFHIHGKTHYGWARLTVIDTQYTITSATLTGFAYETIPNKPIIAGKTTGKMNDMEAFSPDDFGPAASLTNPTPDTPQPASLGLLAMGSPALSIWRREEPVVNTQ
jgi:hypothetical protein